MCLLEVGPIRLYCIVGLQSTNSTLAACPDGDPRLHPILHHHDLATPLGFTPATARSRGLALGSWSSVELVETDTACGSNETPHRAIHQRMTCTILQVFGSTRTGIPLTTLRRDFLTPWCAGA